MGRRLPYDMPSFLSDGLRQAAFQRVPDAVTDVLRRYMDKWPTAAPH
jgi:hypothetical protein